MSESLLLMIPSPSVSIGVQTLGDAETAPAGVEVIAASMIEKSSAKITMIADQRTQGFTGLETGTSTARGLR
jgi:hypothetical protein